MSWRSLARGLINGLVLSVAMFMIGCSGGGDSQSSTTDAQPNLPPDPGIAGLATLQGIDSNNNGVRDDLERYIALTYPGITNAPTRAALTQLAIAFQTTTVVDPSAPNFSPISYATAEMAAASCLMSKQFNDAMTLYHALLAEVLNTLERSRAYFKNIQSTGHEHCNSCAIRV